MTKCLICDRPVFYEHLISHLKNPTHLTKLKLEFTLNFPLLNAQYLNVLEKTVTECSNNIFVDDNGHEPAAIMRRSEKKFYCLICYSSLDPNNYVNHSSAKKHTSKMTAKAVKKLLIYHKFWCNQESGIKCHQVHFDLIDNECLQCIVCDKLLNYNEIVPHIEDIEHKVQVLFEMNFLTQTNESHVLNYPVYFQRNGAYFCLYCDENVEISEVKSHEKSALHINSCRDSVKANSIKSFLKFWDEQPEDLQAQIVLLFNPTTTSRVLCVVCQESCAYSEVEAHLKNSTHTDNNVTHIVNSVENWKLEDASDSEQEPLAENESKPYIQLRDNTPYCLLCKIFLNRGDISQHPAVAEQKIFHADACNLNSLKVYLQFWEEHSEISTERVYFDPTSMHEVYCLLCSCNVSYEATQAHIDADGHRVEVAKLREDNESDSFMNCERFVANDGAKQIGE